MSRSILNFSKVAFFNIIVDTKHVLFRLLQIEVGRYERYI